MKLLRCKRNEIPIVGFQIELPLFSRERATAFINTSHYRAVWLPRVACLMMQRTILRHWFGQEGRINCRLINDELRFALMTTKNGWFRRFCRMETWYSHPSALKITVKKFMLRFTAVWHNHLQDQFTVGMLTWEPVSVILLLEFQNHLDHSRRCLVSCLLTE